MNYSSIIIVLLVAMMGATVASAEDNPFFGSWKVVGLAQLSDYADNGALAKVDPELDGKTIIFAPNQAKGSPVVECEKPDYQLWTGTPESLFQGTLKYPAKDAAALGFKGDKIFSMDFGCSVSTGDMPGDTLLSFHMVDHSTILLNLNGRIYTLKRQSE